MQVVLEVIDGPHTGKSFEFTEHDTFMVGRSPHARCRLTREDRYISNSHFLLEINPPHCLLLDLNSRNGTYLNGERIQAVELNDGDNVKAGHTVFRIHIQKDSSEIATTDEEPSLIPEVIEEPSPPPTRRRKAEPTLSNPKRTEVEKKKPTRTKVDKQAPPPNPKPKPKPKPKEDLIPVLEVEAISEPKSDPAPPPVPEPASKPEPMVPEVIAEPEETSVPVAVDECYVCYQPLTAKHEQYNPNGWLCQECVDASATQAQFLQGYQIIRQIGKGSMGEVHLGIRLEDGLVAAIKTILPAVAGSRKQMQMFLREVEILQNLQHPNIISFYETGEFDGVLYFVMDYIRGVDGEELIATEGPLEVKRAVRIACHLLEALKHAHSLGYVHRDIKPANLLISREHGEEHVRLGDFGVARAYIASQMSGLTMIGDLGGTVPFMAPEQILNYRDVQPSADQFSAAATLYTLLTNEHIYDFPDSIQQQLKLILDKEPVPIRKRRSIPTKLAKVIHKALARDEEDRYADVGEFQQALRTAIGE